MQNNIKRPTVTIGIPVFNEESTIESVISSLLNQRDGSFVLEKIIVASDGSTDNTVDLIKSKFISSNKVTLLCGRKRIGKSRRLKQIFNLNTSDRILIFDGDILINDKTIVNKLIKGFDSLKVGLVSGNTQPVRPNSFFGRIWFANENLWYYTRRDYLNGNNLYNNSGQSIAMTKDFARKVFLPWNTVADQHFIYLSSVKENVEFRFARNAVTFYVPPSTFQDIVLQIRRTRSEGVFLNKYFDESYSSYFLIPVRFKILGLYYSLKNDLIFTLLALTLFNLLRFVIKDTDPLTNKGMWSIAKSTKTNIQY